MDAGIIGIGARGKNYARLYQVGERSKNYLPVYQAGEKLPCHLIKVG